MSSFLREMLETSKAKRRPGMNSVEFLIGRIEELYTRLWCSPEKRTGVHRYRLQRRNRFRYCKFAWQETHIIGLVIEPPVGVLAEQRLADGGEGVDFEQAQPLFERVVDLDLALTTNDDDTTSTIIDTVRSYRVQIWEIRKGREERGLTIPQAEAPPHPAPQTFPCRRSP